MARRALEEALDHSKGRRQFGKTLSEFQAIQIMLAEMATWLDAARLLVYRAAWVKESGNLEHLRRVSAMAKWYATEVSQKIVDHALQIHGGRGVVRGVVVERLYREIRALRIYEGTSEIQKLIIAKDLLAKDLLARDFLKERAGDGL
jgi:acyl-CoA dehydrogenase